MSARTGTMQLFDRFPAVPVAQFRKKAIPKDAWGAAWHLVAPTLERNRNADMQRLLCIAFLEGVRMGMKAEELLEKEPTP